MTTSNSINEAYKNGVGYIKKATGKRLDNGEWVIGELFTWSKYGPVAIICDDSHEKVSQGWRVRPFSIKEII